MISNTASPANGPRGHGACIPLASVRAVLLRRYRAQRSRLADGARRGMPTRRGAASYWDVHVKRRAGAGWALEDDGCDDGWWRDVCSERIGAEVVCGVREEGAHGSREVARSDGDRGSRVFDCGGTVGSVGSTSEAPRGWASPVVLPALEEAHREAHGFRKLARSARDRISRVFDCVGFRNEDCDGSFEPTGEWDAEAFEAFENAAGPHSALARPVDGVRRGVLTMSTQELGELAVVFEKGKLLRSEMRVRDIYMPLQVGHPRDAMSAYDRPGLPTVEMKEALVDYAGDPGKTEPVVPEIFVTPPDDFISSRRYRAERAGLGRPSQAVYLDTGGGRWVVSHFVDEGTGLLTEPPRGLKKYASSWARCGREEEEAMKL